MILPKYACLKILVINLSVSLVSHPIIIFKSQSLYFFLLVCSHFTSHLFKAENTKGGSINVPLTSCLTGLDLSVWQIKTKIVSCHTADSKPVKQEVNSTVMLLPLLFPGSKYQILV